MAWSTPRTWVTSESITAAKLNETRDQLIELGGRTTVGFAEALGAGTTTSTSYVTATTVAGPVVVVNILASTRVMITNSAKLSNDTAFAVAFIGVDISGSATVAAADGMCMHYQAPSGGQTIQMGTVYTLGLGGGGGSTTFAEKVRVNANTGTFTYRRLGVTPLG